MGTQVVFNISLVSSAFASLPNDGKLLGAGAAELTYDARNNRTGVTDSADASKNAEYSSEENNTLSGITTYKEGVPDVTSYEYSADKLLASRISDGVTQKFVWDTNRTIPVMLSDGKYEYLYKGQSERVPFAQVELSTGVVTCLHSDLTGSVTASTSVSGELLGTVDYSPYGEATGPLLSAFGYSGEWVDNITGYTYLRMQWLDTATGTFLSEDPLVQTTNSAFNYTEGNPITQIDPLGLISWSDAASWAGITAMGVGIAALATVSVPVWGPVLAVAATITLVTSITLSTISMIDQCATDGSWSGKRYTSDCLWSNIGAVASVVPMASRLLPQVNSVYKLATKPLPSDSIVVNAWAGTSKWVVGAYDNMGLYVDGLSRGLKSIDKDRNSNANDC